MKVNPLKQTPIDVWSVREKLALASSVQTAGDQNWYSVSRSLKPFGENNRPNDWFSQKNCALQYAELLENVETPKRKRGEKNEDTVQNLIVRKLTFERVEELQKLIEKEKRESEEFDKYIQLLKDEKIDESKLDELFERMRNIQDEEAKEHEEHQKWLQKRAEKYATMAVGKQKLGPIRSKQDSQAIATGGSSTPTTSLPSTPSTVVSSDANDQDIPASVTDRPIEEKVSHTSSTTSSSLPNKNTETPLESSSSNVGLTNVETNEDSQFTSNVQSDFESNAKSSDKSPSSVLSTLLRSPTHKAPSSPVSSDLIAKNEIKTEPTISSDESAQSNTKKDTPTETNSSKKSSKSTVAVEEMQVETTSSGEQEEMVVEEANSKDLSTDDRNDTNDDEPVGSKSSDAKSSESTIPLQEKEIKKELLDNTNSNDSVSNKALDEQHSESSRSESRRKRFSSVTSSQHPPTRRSGRFKGLRSGNEEIETRSRSVGSPQIASNSDSDYNQTVMNTQENSNASFAETANEKSNSSAIASVLLDDRKGATSQSEETNDSVNSDQETSMRGGPPSRPLSVSESIPNSPASTITDDPEQMKEYKTWRKNILLLWRQAATHKYSSLFTYAVTDEEAKGYSTVVYRPIDLTMIRKRIENGTIRSTADFQHDMMLLFQNAIMYNNIQHEVHQMAVEMQKEILDSIDDFIETQQANSTALNCPFNQAVHLPQDSNESHALSGTTSSVPSTTVSTSTTSTSSATHPSSSSSTTTTTTTSHSTTSSESKLRKNDQDQPETSFSISSRRKSRC